MDDPNSPSFMKLAQLQELISKGSSAQLEAGVETGRQILSDIKAALADAKGVPEIVEWIKSSDELESQAAYQRIVVGVVGSTGAGKSSVINAVLDEECLVPTNSMRACTAVITEIAYNNSDQQDQKYRAEIHFISKDEWVRELRVMLADMATSQDSLGAEHTTSESEAGIAYSKIRSVYPFLGSEDVKKCRFDMDGLTEHPSVEGLLGNVKQLSSSNSKDFVVQLKQFVDSKEKTTSRKKEPDAMEYWPLVKVVKVFVRSPILRSGLVLVDLPGVHDSNAARSAVAAKYISQCTGLWVVAPIARAVDDKIAQTLLGDSFKRQLQFDGTYSSITFICSKVDDISVTETLKVLPEEEEANQLTADVKRLEANYDEMKEQVSTIKDQKYKVNEEIDQCMENIGRLKSAIRRAGNDDHTTLFSPAASRKRPSYGGAPTPHKRPRTSHGSDSKETDSTLEEPPVASEIESKDETISVEIVRQKLEEAETDLHTLREEFKKLRENGPNQNDLKELRKNIKSVNGRAKYACIKYRNDYARPTIQGQFAEGIRDIDQENASHDEENFNPSCVHRDYKEVAQKLPVFCVSSKAYQKLSGRLENDEPTIGFDCLEETEIPALQKHALGIVHETRAVTCRQFLAGLNHSLTSLQLLAVQSGQPHRIADDLRGNELQAVAQAVEELKKKLHSEVGQAFEQYRNRVDSILFKRFASAARVAAAAAAAAIPTANSWICHKDDGGMAFSTFRATCNRDGIFNGARGLVDFNTTLADPMTKYVGGPWEYAFTRYLPESMDDLAQFLERVLQSFRLGMSQRAQLMAVPSFALATRQLENMERGVRDTTKCKAKIRDGQKQANRLFVPTIGKAMAGAYTTCAQETGAGCFRRMKAHFVEHVENVKGTMFQQATRDAENALRRTIDTVEMELQKSVERIVVMISKVYRTVLVNQNVFKSLPTTQEEVQSLLNRVDGRFELVLRPLAESANLEVEDPAAMDIDHDVPATTKAGDSHNMADDNAVPTNTELPVEVDTPMENA